MNQHSEILIIEKTIENHFNLPEGSLQEDTRKEEIRFARQIAMFLSKKLTKFSLATIGSQLANRDHATVLRAIKIVNDRIDTDKLFKPELDDIEKKILPALKSMVLLSDIFMLGFGVRRDGKKSIHTGKYFSFDVSCAVAKMNGFNTDLIACFWNTNIQHVEDCIATAYQEDVILMNKLLNKKKDE